MATIATDLEHLEHVLSEALANEWEAQGHHMTGKIVKDIEYVTKQEANKITLSGMIYAYGNIQASGVNSDKIPFSGTAKRGQGTGGISKYIQALKKYAEIRMNIPENKSLGVAFAIAKTQKKEGMPTRGSYTYSNTGKRTEWIEDAFKRDEDKITEAIREMCYNLLSVQIDTLLKKWNIELNKE